MSWQDFLLIDLAPLLAAILSSLCCALCGNFLVLRGQSMMVDAISHIVLPGMVVAYLLSGLVSFFYMFWGAMAAAILGILVIEALSRFHDRGAVLGMVFSLFFALGILLLELFVDNRVHLDVQHILFGSLEAVYWSGLGEGASIGLLLQSLPINLVLLGSLLIFLLLCLFLFYKELVLVSFDSKYARSQFAHIRWLDYGFALVITFIIISAFRLVGLILIVGMFVIPPLIASFIAHRLPTRILVSCVMAIVLCLLGYGVAVYLPFHLVGAELSFNLGGSIVSLAALVAFVVLFVKKDLWQLIFH